MYVVVEDKDDHCIVELMCDLPIRPQETVGKHMIEAAYQRPYSPMPRTHSVTSPPLSLKAATDGRPFP